jgi:hypothetical protein
MKIKSHPSPNEKFTKALASVLSADPKKIRDKIAQAKNEKQERGTAAKATLFLLIEYVEAYRSIQIR